MSDFVLDASAILALIYSEPGKDRVEELLDLSVVGRVNVTEILTKMLERGSSIDEAVETLADLELNIVEFNEDQSIKAAELRPLTKHLGLSLGDRACLALAIEREAIAVTADKNWAKLNVCKVEVIR